MTGNIISGRRGLTRRQLFENAALAASGLHDMGIGEGDAVAVMLRNDFPYFEILLGAGMLGARTVPINWHYKGGEAGYILTDAGAKALVIHCDLLPQLEGVLPAGLPVLTVATPAEIQEAYGLAPELCRVPQGATDWAQWMAGQAPWTAPPAAFRGAMLYTSGSTGRPKGVRRVAPAEEQERNMVEMVNQVAASIKLCAR